MKIKELIQFIQSANINFMIGSGASRPYLATLGSIENWLTCLAEDDKSSDRVYKIVKASIYRKFYVTVIAPNKIISYSSEPLCIETKENYRSLLTAWNGILNKRRSKIQSKQVNLFTTNVDLKIEFASSGLGIELNDGFKGSVDMLYNESNFMRSINQTSLHFQYVAEVPVFNLMKVHGSINWEQRDANSIRNNNVWYFDIEEALKKIPDDKFVEPTYVDSEGNKKDKSYDQLIADAKEMKDIDESIYDEFINAYSKLVIVNPTKRKFEQTVVDFHFYELMRIYANALEKENALLFVTGFSFADEHIATITKRAADNNPTLQIVIFAYNDVEEANYRKYLWIDSACINNNIKIITPSSFRAANMEDEYKRLMESIEVFDLKSVAGVFKYIESQIHE